VTIAGVYTVTGRREYRGHAPGETFTEFIPPGPERRAIDRGDIELLKRVIPELLPGSWTLPVGWGNRKSDGTLPSEFPEGRD